MKKISILLIVMILLPTHAVFSDAYISNPEKTKKCEKIFEIGRNKINISMHSSEFAEKFDSHEWIEKAHFYGVYIIAGMVPVETDFKSTIFCIHLYPNEKNWSDYVIYLRLNIPKDETFDQSLSDQRGLSFLKGVLSI